jgi:hypothetical protein
VSARTVTYLRFVRFDGVVAIAAPIGRCNCGTMGLDGQPHEPFCDYDVVYMGTVNDPEEAAWIEEQRQRSAEQGFALVVEDAHAR